MKQFNPARDVAVAGTQMVNQIIGTGLNTVSQLNAGVASMALGVFGAIPAPPPPPSPPQMSLPNPFGGQKMSIAPTGEVEEDFDVME
jgi:hypothetical protein